MTQFVPNSYPDFDTDSSGMHVAFRDRGGSHHGLVTYQTGPGGGNRKRGTVVTTGNGVSGLPADRLQELLSWVKPVHLPILDPAQFVGMTPITSGALTVSHVPDAGDFSGGAIRLVASAAVTNVSVRIPLPPRLEVGVSSVGVKAAGAIHIRAKCSDWSRVTRLYVNLCEQNGVAHRKVGVIVEVKSRYGVTDPLYSDAWSGKWRTFSISSAEFSNSGTPAAWGKDSRYYTLTDVQFTVSCTDTVTLDIDRVYSPDWPVGIITPIFDGWYDTARDYVQREFLPRGWGAGGSANRVEGGGIYPAYADLLRISNSGFDVFAHGHDLAGTGNPIAMSSGTTAASFARTLSQQRAALLAAGVSPDGMRWHQWLTNSGEYAESDMAGILKRQGVAGSRMNTSDATWGVNPFRTTYTSLSTAESDPWLPYRGGFNRRAVQCYENLPTGGDYGFAGSDPAKATLRKRIEYAALTSQTVLPYTHHIVDNPGQYDVSTEFGRDWIANMDELERAGKIIVTNPTTLEYLTFWRPGETFMRWDGEWVYRHDPTKIAF